MTRHAKTGDKAMGLSEALRLAVFNAYGYRGRPLAPQFVASCRCACCRQCWFNMSRELNPGGQCVFGGPYAGYASRAAADVEGRH